MKTKTIGERLLILRNEYNLSSEKLATLVNVTRVTIDNIEKGLSNPYKSNVERIAMKLGTTYEWLSTGKGHEGYSIPAIGGMLGSTEEVVRKHYVTIGREVILSEIERLQNAS